MLFRSFIEWLTHEIEERVWAELGRIDGMGGMVRAIEQGYPQRVIATDAYEKHKAQDSGEVTRVGVNRFKEDEAGRKVRTYKAKPEVARRHVEDLKVLRAERDNGAVKRALKEIQRVAQLQPKGRDNNMMPPIMEAVRNLATVGEICAALREVWGEYEEAKFV